MLAFPKVHRSQNPVPLQSKMICSERQTSHRILHTFFSKAVLGNFDIWPGLFSEVGKIRKNIPPLSLIAHSF